VSSPPSAAPPDLGPRFRADAVLGAGAMAVVYSGVELATGRAVAIKVLRAELAGAVEDLRLLREARLEKALAHPRIVEVLETGTVEGRPFTVMPLLTGETLRARLQREIQLPLEDAVDVIVDVAEALDHAHAHGVIHRDVKPENVMCTAAGAVLMDLGIALAFEGGDTARLTETGVTVGTPLYMSPEQATGERSLDARSDVYALGCVAYELLAGRPPFTAATASAVRAQHALERPGSLLIIRPDLPQAVDEAVATALAKSPADRPASAGAFAERLATAARAPGRSRTPRVARRVWLGVGAAATLAVGAALLAPERSGEGEPPAWVLVGAVTDSGAAAGIGLAIREMVIAELQRSRRLAIVPPEHVRLALDAARLPDTTTLTVGRARELAVRTAVRAVVAGDVRRISPTVYSVSLVAVEADDGTELLRRTSTIAADGSDLAATVDAMARALRRELGDRAEDLQAARPMLVVQTPSFEAYRLYADAMEVQRRGGFDGAIHRLRQAVALDSGFATAWATLAMDYIAVRQPDSARVAFAQAARHADRLAPAERDRLRGDAAYNLDHDVSAAATAYQRFLEARPASLGGWNNLGLYLSGLGRYEEALAAFERALHIDPLMVGPRQIQLLNIAAELVTLGRLDSARAIQSRMQGAPADYLRLLILNASNDWAALAGEAAAIADAPVAERFVRLPAVVHAAGAHAALANVAEAERRLREALTTATGADQRTLAHALVLLDETLGRSPGWALPDAIVRDTVMGAQLLRGLYAAARGDRAAAERALRALEALGERDRRRLGHGVALLTARAASLRGDWDAAAAITPLATAGEHDPLGVDRPSSVALRRFAAQVLDSTGRPGEAAEMRALMRRAERMPPAHMMLRGFVMGSPRGDAPDARD
jgi:tetratricopeptide (TPR) repeat protein